MGNFFQKVRDDFESDSRPAAYPAASSTPITDSLTDEVHGLLKQIEAPYKACLKALREKEQELNSQQSELERQLREFRREKEQFEQNKNRVQQVQEASNALQSENDQLKNELQELKKLTSASYNSRKRQRDVRPGDTTHEDLLEMYQKYYDTKYRQLLAQVKQSYKAKESRCTFLSNILKVACKHSCDHVTQAVTRELKALHQPPSTVSDPDHDDDTDLVKEKWMDRSGAFGLLLSAAGIESSPEQCPPSLKQQVFQELQNKNSSFKTAYEANPQGMDDVLDSAVNISWVMNTLVPPASFHQPEEFHDEWHEIVASTSEDEDPECDYELVYCRPVLFFGAEGTVGKVGSVKRKKAQPDHIVCNPLLQSAHSLEGVQHASVELQCMQSSLNSHVALDDQDLSTMKQAGRNEEDKHSLQTKQNAEK